MVNFGDDTATLPDDLVGDHLLMSTRVDRVDGVLGSSEAVILERRRAR